MIVYYHDSNAILSEALKSKGLAEQLAAITKLHTQFKNRGIKPKIHIMDKKCPSIVKKYLRRKKSQLQLAPSNMQRANEAKTSIGTFKDHFITGLVTGPQ